MSRVCEPFLLKGPLEEHWGCAGRLLERTQDETRLRSVREYRRVLLRPWERGRAEIDRA